MTKNQLEYRAQNEQMRSNLAREAETKRYNLVQEELQRASLAQDLSKFNRSQTEIERSNLARERETRRSNVAHEVETHRANVASLDELSRHNRLVEARDAAQLRLSEKQLQETVRHNDRTINLGYANVALGQSQLKETSRSNVAREKETYRSNLARESENHRANVVSETITSLKNREAARHNVTVEGISSTEAKNTYKLGTYRNRTDRLNYYETVRHNVSHDINDAIRTGVKAAETIIQLVK